MYAKRAWRVNKKSVRHGDFFDFFLNKIKKKKKKKKKKKEKDREECEQEELGLDTRGAWRVCESSVTCMRTKRDVYDTRMWRVYVNCMHPVSEIICVRRELDVRARTLWRWRDKIMTYIWLYVRRASRKHRVVTRNYHKSKHSLLQTFFVTSLKQNEAQSVCAESTHKGVSISARNT